MKIEKIMPFRSFLTFTATLCLAINAHAVESICFGKVSNGKLENGMQLPAQGENFEAYSWIGVKLGRTNVHSKVAQIVIAAYGQLNQSAPGKKFMYGETGWVSGGRFRPHRTHQNGLSVDFFVPVINVQKKSVLLPIGLGNKFGYNIEFDKHGKFKNHLIDFEAMAEHLYQLEQAAQANGAGIKQVIFDRNYLPKLFATKRGEFLKTHVHFMKGKAWVRHDEHYHVDFDVPCKQMTEEA